MGDLTVTETAYGADDLSWLGSAHGFEAADDITLVADDFLTQWPDGRVPSGVALSLLSSGANANRYGKYAGGASEVQKLTVATSGNTTVGFQGVNAAATALTADGTGATALIGLLEGLPDIDKGEVAVAAGSGGDAGKLIVTFGGKWAGKDVPTLSVAGTGTAIATGTAGGSAGVEGRDKFAGHLKKGVKVTAGHMISAAIIRHGKVIKSKLPAGHGLDAAAEADAVGRIIYLP